MRVSRSAKKKPRRSDWKTSHSLAKPLRSGSPAMAAEPSRKSAAVRGMR